MADVRASWTELKAVAQSKSIEDRIQSVSFDSNYFVALPDGAFTIFTTIKKDGGADQLDFENNFQSGSNAIINQNVVIGGTSALAADVNANRELLVTTSLQGGGDPSGKPGCPVISSKLRFDYSTTNITVPSAYVTLYEYNGSGKLFGWVFDFNSDSVRVKMTIDSTEEIFELTLDQIESLQAYSGGGCDDDSSTSSGLLGFLKKASGNKLYFDPPCSIAYESQVKIEAQRTTSSDKRMDERMVILTKES